MDISAVNQTFQKFEKDEEGRALIPSVLEFYKIKKNKFMERAFTLLHVGKEEDVASVSFKQFVYLLWNFCTLGDNMGKKCVLLFAATFPVIDGAYLMMYFQHNPL